MSFPAGEYPLHPPPPPATAAATLRRKHSSLPPSTQGTISGLGCGFGAAKEPAGGAPTPPRPARAPTSARNVFGTCLAMARARAHTVAGIASAQRLSLQRTISGLYKGGGGTGSSSGRGAQR